MKSNKNKHNFNLLKDNIKIWALELGFPQIGISDIDLSTEKSRYLDWLEKKHQANMYYLENNLKKKFNPEELVKNTCRIISVILPYSPPPQNSSHPIASYALGTDYHKIIRKRLQQLASKIKSEVHDFEYRVFCDSAPILEKALAAKSGLGWIGKNNLLINPKYGSYFFLGEIYINLPLSIDDPIKNYCGNCTKCLQACPTKALIAANQLDAARCLSYQTIENKTEIPESFHELLFSFASHSIAVFLPEKKTGCILERFQLCWHT